MKAVRFFTRILSVALSAVIGLLSITTGLWSDQHDSLKSITKVTDDYYLMDYTYNYDLDTLLESRTGNSTTVGLLLYSFADIFLQLNPCAKKLVSSMGLYSEIDSKLVAGVMQKVLDFTGFGCTTFNATTPSGDELFARNYDYMDSPGMTVWTHPENGYASVSTVSLYFLGYGGDFFQIFGGAGVDGVRAEHNGNPPVGRAVKFAVQGGVVRQFFFGVRRNTD